MPLDYVHARVFLCSTHLSYLQEYETQSSPEARLVKQFDLLEMILQAHEYEELEGTPGRLQDFFDSTSGKSPACLAFVISHPRFLHFASLALFSAGTCHSGSLHHGSGLGERTVQ